MEATTSSRNDGSSCETAGARPVLPPRTQMHEPHAPLMPQTEPVEVPSAQRRPTSHKPRRAPPLCAAGPAEMMKILTLDGEWRTIGASPLAAAHEILGGDEPVDDCAVCGGSLFHPADDDEGPFAMSPRLQLPARADGRLIPWAGCVVAHARFRLSP